MTDIYQLLRQKESELSRLHKEVESLRVALPLLAEDTDSAGSGERGSETTPWTERATGTTGLLSGEVESGSRGSFWSRVKARRSE
jgi:hypothetical protein